MEKRGQEKALNADAGLGTVRQPPLINVNNTVTPVPSGKPKYEPIVDDCAAGQPQPAGFWKSFGLTKGSREGFHGEGQAVSMSRGSKKHIGMGALPGRRWGADSPARPRESQSAYHLIMTRVHLGPRFRI